MIGIISFPVLIINFYYIGHLIPQCCTCTGFLSGMACRIPFLNKPNSTSVMIIDIRRPISLLSIQPLLQYKPRRSPGRNYRISPVRHFYSESPFFSLSFVSEYADDTTIILSVCLKIQSLHLIYSFSYYLNVQLVSKLTSTHGPIKTNKNKSCCHFTFVLQYDFCPRLYLPTYHHLIFNLTYYKIVNTSVSTSDQNTGAGRQREPL